MPKQDYIYKRRSKTMYTKKINSYGKRKNSLYKWREMSIA